MEGDNLRLASIVKPESLKADEVKNTVHEYMDNYSDEKDVLARRSNYTTLVNQFYDIVTNFYEFGWGQSFHFAPRRAWESFECSIHRHEMFLAHHLEMFKGMTVLDCGCGVGGPARCIAAFSEANIVCLNNNDYQIDRAKKLTAEAGLMNQISFMKADFMNIPVPDDTYDAIYAIEATCHAPDKLACYSELYRILKPGKLLGIYEWVMTDRYDPQNPEHVRIKEGIEKGNALPELQPSQLAEQAMRDAGFEILDSRDVATTSDETTPWYLPLSGTYSWTGFKHTRCGRWFTHKMVCMLEWIKLAPEGTTEISRILMETAEDIVKGGEMQLFTPMWFILARKPEEDAGQ